MDPITAALNLATQIAEIVKIAIEGQPPDVRAELWRLYVQDQIRWHQVWDRIWPLPPQP